VRIECVIANHLEEAKYVGHRPVVPYELPDGIQLVYADDRGCRHTICLAGVASTDFGRARPVREPVDAFAQPRPLEEAADQEGDPIRRATTSPSTCQDKGEGVMIMKNTAHGLAGGQNPPRRTKARLPAGACGPRANSDHPGDCPCRPCRSFRASVARRADVGEG
jgi:hypothetical protein